MNGKRMPRWPLALIGAPAAVAVWSGWVGLGQLCGFGMIHPLPGIWDSATINTAITLPIGVEAYGAYALGAWLTPGTSARARKFARRSAIGALALGMLGQVAYHLLAAAHATHAPWPVTMFVSCLPVIALALGTALAHLLREPGEDESAGAMPGGVDDTDTVSVEVPDPYGSTQEAVADAVPLVPPAVPRAVPAVVPVDGVPPVRARRSRTVTPVRTRAGRSKAPEKVFAAELAAGELPSVRAIKSRMRVGTDRARVIRDQLAQDLSRAQSLPEEAHAAA